MKLIKIALSASILLAISGCAASYHEINPPKLDYHSSASTPDNQLGFEYKYNLLNQKYAKKEVKFNVKLVAIKITNNTGHDLVFNKDIKIAYTNGVDAILMDNPQVFATLKQQTPYYLLYLLLAPMTFNTNTTSNGVTTSSSSTHIGLVIGPGLALGNMLYAGGANEKFDAELTKYSLNNTTIKTGTTVYGLIGVVETGYEGLKLRLVK